MITEHHGFHAQPRISEDDFEAVVVETGSPWAQQARGLYRTIVNQGHDPAVWLAIGLREHRLLTDPDAIALKFGTNSWTNARSVVAGIETDGVVTTEELRAAGITNRDGPYVRYKSVRDSLLDGMTRIDYPGHVYRQRKALSIGQVLRIWTESDAEGYIKFVVDCLNKWQLPDEPTSWWDDEAFAYIPDQSGEYGYPAGNLAYYDKDRLIIHITEGSDSLGWLNGANGNSAHYLTWPDGSPRAQLLPERVAAWAAGNRAYNERGIQLEHEKRYIDAPWSDEEYRNLAKIAARIIKRNPLIKPDREHIIGHSEVPDPNRPGRFGGAGNHQDPGPGFEWPRFMALVLEELASDPTGGIDQRDPNAVRFVETDKWIVNVQTDAGHQVDMLDFWRSAGGIEVCGYPLEGMLRDEDGVYRQLCENVLLECWPDGFGHYPGPHYRFGGLGQRYKELVERIEAG